MADIKAFKKEVQSYLGGSVVTSRRDEPRRRSRPTQEFLAWEMYRTKETLSRKLNGSLQLNVYDVRDIGEILIYWKRITYRSQLQQLFGHADYTLLDDDWRREPWSNLIDDIQPAEEILHPLQQATESRKDKSSETPEIHNIPFPRNALFTGRTALLKQIDQLLMESGSQPIAISGLGGIGKTQLALEYAHRRHPEVFRAVLWVNATDETTLQISYDSLVRILALPEREPDRHVQAVQTWLEEHDKWLLILDNADDLELAHSFLPIKRKGHILLTTRSQIVGNLAKRIGIEEMEFKEGLLFLFKRASMVQSESDLSAIAPDVRETGRELVELLGGVPLALDQAGAYIEETETSIAKYLQILKQESYRYLLDRRGSSYGYHPEAITATVELSIKKACERHPLAADILHFCSFLASDAIPEEVLGQADDLKHNTVLLDETIAILRRYSLIKRNAQGKTFSMHPLVQTVLIDNMPPDLRGQWLLRVVRTLDKAFPEIETEDWRRSLTQVMFWVRELPYELTAVNEYNAVVNIIRLFWKLCVIPNLRNAPLVNFPYRGNASPNEEAIVEKLLTNTPITTEDFIKALRSIGFDIEVETLEAEQELDSDDVLPPEG